MRYEDFFETFHTPTTPTAHRLHDEFTRIMNEFRKVRAEREQQVQYLQTVLQHIAPAVLSYDGTGEIELANTAARKLFKVNRLNHIDRLEKFSPELVAVFKTIRAGQQRVVKVMDEGEQLQLPVRATEFVRGGRRLTLVAIQNNRGELEEQELEAWQNLIRVLTHEIRNSITPIASLATTTNSVPAGFSPQPGIDSGEIEDVRLAVGTIQKRSDGLLRFVEVFRSLYKLPEPRLERLELQPLFDHLLTFFEPKFREAGVAAEFTLDPPALSVPADRDLIEQVLINLLTNSLQALPGIEPPLSFCRNKYLDSESGKSVTAADLNSGSVLRRWDEDKLFRPRWSRMTPDGTLVMIGLQQGVTKKVQPWNRGGSFMNAFGLDPRTGKVVYRTGFSIHDPRNQAFGAAGGNVLQELPPDPVIDDGAAYVIAGGQMNKVELAGEAE